MIHQLPKVLQDMLPFAIVSRETVVSKSMITYARESVQHCSFKAASDIHAAVKATELLLQQRNQMNRLVAASQQGITIIISILLK